MNFANRPAAVLAAFAVIMASTVMSGCTDAEMASRNLSKASDYFEVTRRVVFFNGITDSVPLEIIGLCSIRDAQNQLEVTCKTGPTEFKKHFLGLSDNMTYFVEQLEPREVSAYHYRVSFKPQAILPDVDLRFAPRGVNSRNILPEAKVDFEAK